jgi:hypothetical protein
MRKIKTSEARLFSKLLAVAKLELDITNIEVVELNDGGMGSLGIGKNYSNISFGKQVAKYKFKDEDGVEVFFALNLDTNGELYEIDVWKIDFSPTRTLL